MSENYTSDRYWPWFLLLAAGFGAVPWLVFGVSGPVVLGFFCGAIATKWFVFGVQDFKTRQLHTGIDREEGSDHD